MGKFVGPLSEEEKLVKINEALGLLRGRGTTAKCPRCGHNNWTPDLIGFLVSSMPVAGFSIPPPHVPTLTLTCNNCGATLLHNLNVLGIKL